MRVIILTKNISYEVEVQKELQLLNHEVFVTRNEKRDHLLNECAKIFNCLFISETISDKEFKDVYNEVSGLYSGKIVRFLSENDPIERENLDVEYVQRSFMELRGFWANLTATKKLESIPIISLKEFKNTLSKQERLFFRNLDEVKIISRKDMCWEIWREEVTDSRKTQLSNLVKNVNIKLEKYGHIDKRVQSYRGKGYVLQ